MFLHKFIPVVCLSVSLSACVSDQITLQQIQTASVQTGVNVNKGETDSIGSLAATYPFLVPILVPAMVGDYNEKEGRLSQGFSGELVRDNYPVALVLTPSLQSYVFKGGPASFGGSARSATVPLGEIVALNAPKILNLAYAQVAVVPSVQAAIGRYPLIVEPHIKQYEYQYAGLVKGRILSDITIENTLYDTTGQQLISQQAASGFVDNQFAAIGSEFSGENHEMNHALAATKAVMVAFADALQKARTQPIVRAKLATQKDKELATTKPLPELQFACINWSPSHGITNYDAALKEAEKKLDDGFKSLQDLIKADRTLLASTPQLNMPTFQIKTATFDVNVKGGKLNLGADEAMKALKTTDFIIQGEYKKAAEEASDYFISKMMPLVASYKTLLDAVATSINAVIANWVEDLYLTKEYQEVVNLLTKEWQTGSRNNTPYMLSSKIKGAGLAVDETVADLRTREAAMFNMWLNKFDGGVETFMYQNSARIRQAFGGELTERQLFNRFLVKAYEDQAAQINEAYKLGIEYNAYIEARKAGKEVIEAVCAKAHIAQNTYNNLRQQSAIKTKGL